MQDDSQAVKLVKMIADSIIQADLDRLQNFANVPGLNTIISQSIINIVTVFRDSTQLNEDYLNHIFFYRDTIKKLGNREKLTQEDIQENLLITHERRQELLPLIETVSQLDKKSSEMEQKLRKIVTERDSLKTQFSKLEVEKQQMEQTFNKSFLELESNHDLQKSVLNLEEKQEQLKNQCMQLESQLLELRKQLLEREEQVTELNKENKKLQEKIKKLEKENKKSEKQHKKAEELSISLDNYKSTIKELQKNHKKTLAQNLELSQKIQTFEKQKKSIIQGIEQEGLIDSKQNSLIMLVSQNTQKQKSMLLQKQKLLGSCQQKLKLQESAVKEKTITIRDKNKVIKVKEEEIAQKNKLIKKYEEEVSTLENTIVQLKQSLSQKQKSSALQKKQVNQIFVDSNSIISHLGLDPDYGNCFIQTITKEISQGKIQSMVSLYNYSVHKSQNFHKRVDSKKNIMLLCLTQDKNIIGAFSSSGFSLRAEPKDTKAFIFNFPKHDKNMKIYKLKAGRQSIVYDYDYILFGQEQLCIQNGKNQLSTYMVSAQSKELHYNLPTFEQRQTFLSSTVPGTSQITLHNYEIIQLHFA